MTANRLNLQLVSLFGAIILYSFSFPWPKQVGWLEMMIGILMIIAMSKPMICILTFREWKSTFLFLSLLIFPSFVGVCLYHNPVQDVIRDVIPFFYFCMPLLYFAQKPTIQESETLLAYLPWLLSVVGIIYAVRELNSFWGQLHIMKYTTDYLMQAPSVLFAAIHLSLYAILSIKRKQCFKSLLYIILALLPMSVIYFTVLRAPMVLIVVSIGLFVVLILKEQKKHLLYSSIVFIAVAVFMFRDIIMLVSPFIDKQHEYGANGKLLEIEHLFSLMFDRKDSLLMMLGKGWGASWYSPAAGGDVRFTHSLLTYVVLKMGLAGLGAFVFFIMYLIKTLLGLLRGKLSLQEYTVVIPIMAVFIVNIWLEAGYKTLDFGLVLLLYFVLSQSAGTSVDMGDPNEKQEST